MIKKLITISAILSANSSFAVTDQLNFAEKYLKLNTDISIFKELLISTEIIIDKREPNKDVEYADINGDIYKGQKNKSLRFLQKQLKQEETGIYNDELFNAVKDFQKTNELNPTGIIDKTTWFNMYSQPLAWKIKTVKAARDNWNSIVEKNKDNKSDKMIIINIPSMKLYLYGKKAEDNSYSLLMTSPVVVGKTKTQTPLVDFELISLKYNPTWTPTTNIIKRNLFKNGELNIKWVEDHSLTVLDENGEEKSIEELPSLEKSDLFKIKFVQASGEKNALGNLKFETSSKENIYLHDTNERNLFSYNTRIYSSGCIRVKEYVNLAAYVSGKPVDYIQKNIERKKMYYEKIPNRIPVYFDYSQVHFNNSETPKFYSDIYSKIKDN